MFEGINPYTGKGESIHTYKINENGTIDDLCLSTNPYIVENYVQSNLGDFRIDSRFIKFYEKDNIQKILNKNNINDEITDIILLNIVYDTNKMDTMVAWIMCEDKNYFLSWEKCRNSIKRLKDNSIKSYFISDDYNYFTLYSDEEFCKEFRTKEGNYVDNINSSNNFTVNICHDGARFSLFKMLEVFGYSNVAVDDYTYMLSKDNYNYKFVFSRNSEWGNAYSLDIYNSYETKLNDYTVCHIVAGDFIINDEGFNKLNSIFRKSIKVDYDKLILHT